MISILLPAAKTWSENIKPALSILNPVEGQSGIYDVFADDGTVFPAYVNMEDDGGYWILLVRWTGSTTTASETVSYRNALMEDGPLKGYTNSPLSYPVVPAGKVALNSSRQWLLKNANAGWITRYGKWQRGSMIPMMETMSETYQFPIVTEIGVNALYPIRVGWNRATGADETLGFWTQIGPNGPCGGNGVSGSNKICPANVGPGVWNTDHIDKTSVKEFYIRALNKPE